MRRSIFLLAGAAVFWVGGAGAQIGPLDPHLNWQAWDQGQAERAAAALVAPEDFDLPQPFEGLSGGAGGIRADDSRDVFSEPSANMAFDRLMDFQLGNALFRKLWVAAPSSTKASDGLGPLYNARSCENCHIRDGRGMMPGPRQVPMGLLVRLGMVGDGVLPGAPVPPHPVLGYQVQTFAAPGLAAEAVLGLEWAEESVTLADGMVVSLRRPLVSVTGAEGAALSARLAPQMIGLGLLEAIPFLTLAERVDPEDADGNGISGRLNMVWSAAHQQMLPGRFGWKAGRATMADQTASALFGDMGLSNPLVPLPQGDCTAAQKDCLALPNGQDAGVRDGLEVDQASFDLINFYSRNLAVPRRRDEGDPQVLQGKALFNAIGCVDCHRPAYVTHALPERPEQSFQLIWPYSDLLLHDMGPGLADDLPEGLAAGSEWRTAPLWGLGLTAQVSGQFTLLHDGRARSILEAVLWHGGEAQGPRDMVVSMPAEDRAALLKFLESL
jgi:CxxC motif-containing protein (DUF1111 family)